jgi:serine/threonine protein kinase
MVYKGFYKNQMVAVKCFKGLSRTTPPDRKKIFAAKREAFILAKCSHRHILNMIGCSFVDWFVVMEYAVGSLNQALYCTSDINPVYDSLVPDPQDPDFLRPPSLMLIEWTMQILSGLHYLHHLDVLHRDIKTSNIILCHEGRSLVAKVSDFGESTIVGMSSTATNNSTVVKKVIGTRPYMAPEILDLAIANHESRYSKASDIYAFGVLANEVFTGSYD